MRAAMEEIYFRFLKAPNGSDRDDAFFDQELRSDYMVGLVYTLRPGNELLADKVSRWIALGVVEVVPPLAAKLSGKE
jgi:hypothetical protein